MTRAGTGPEPGPRHPVVIRWPTPPTRRTTRPTRRTRATRPARRIGLLCSAIALCNVVALVGDLCSPVLLPRQPMVLVLLSPRTAYLVATAHDVPFAVFFAVAVLRLCAADPLHFMLGRTTGPAALAAARRIGVLRRVVDRLPPAGGIWLVGIAASPTAKTMCASGAAGLPGRRAAVANVAGTAARVLVIWTAGRALPGTGAVMASIAPWVALPGGAVVVAATLVRRWRPAPEPA